MEREVGQKQLKKAKKHQQLSPRPQKRPKNDPKTAKNRQKPLKTAKKRSKTVKNPQKRPKNPQKWLKKAQKWLKTQIIKATPFGSQRFPSADPKIGVFPKIDQKKVLYKSDAPRPPKTPKTAKNGKTTYPPLLLFEKRAKNSQKQAKKA